ncbi:MAG: hypothetical protein KBC43_10430 [Bacteroidales bacterium]|nr:hypothetical protein [Bacteroidales bacterium]
MNRRINFRIIISFIILMLTVIACVYGQPPMPPEQHGSNGNPGGFAPIDGGLIEMLLGVFAYAIYKMAGAIRKNKASE